MLATTCRSAKQPLLVLAILLAGSGITRPATAEVPSAPADDPNRYALLVGCTEYPMNERISTLVGPKNDVRLFREVLLSRFGFAEEDIIELVGWPEDESRRPTRNNIKAAFQRLAAKARPGDQVVIMMAGHGTQFPIPRDQEDPFDPENFEPDGRDEYFLPADTGRYSMETGYPNAIRDRTFGKWLDGIRQRGASVWIIFDCCHAGTMTRSVGDVEQDRYVDPVHHLGIPQELFDEADQKVARARARHAEHGIEPQPPVRHDAGDDSWGGLVAFYAAQPHERAPEHPWPIGAARASDNVYGVFSYLLCQTLKQSEGTMTYRDLARRLVSQYRAERGSQAPTPLFDGDLDRDLLGMDLGPRVPIYLEHAASGVQLSAGSLVGLTPGTILSVHPPGGQRLEELEEEELEEEELEEEELEEEELEEEELEGEEKVLGYVRVTAVNPMYAQLESIAHELTEAAVLEELPDAARCRIVAQDLGDLRVKVVLAGQEFSAEAYNTLQAAIAELSEEVAALVRVVDEQAEADWVLQVVSPEMAAEQFEIAAEDAQIFLLAGSGRQDTLAAETDLGAARVYGRYPAGQPTEMARRIGSDLRKIFAWRNVWRVATTLEADRTLGGGDVEFQVLSADVPPDDQGQQAADHILRPGQRVHLYWVNNGLFPYWVTLVYLDANYGIHIPLPPREIQPGQRIGPMPVNITDGSFGPEGFVVMSVPVRAHRDQPDYSFLVQHPLGGPERGGWRTGEAQSPFAELMESLSAARPHTMRQASFQEPSTPQTVSWTWETVRNQ